MAVRNRITEKNPPTGALPAEQTAENAKKKGGSGHVWQIDKMVYQLVENNVDFAGEQFSDNLKFNAKTLTDVIYDNIHDILEDKFDDDELVEWLSEELADNGGVLPSASSKPVSEDEDSGTSISGIDDLKVQIDAVVKLVRANKPAFLQHMKEIDEGVTSLKQQIGNHLKQISSSSLILQKRNTIITQLVEKLNVNQQRYDKHVTSTTNLKTEFEDKISEF